MIEEVSPLAIPVELLTKGLNQKCELKSVFAVSCAMQNDDARRSIFLYVDWLTGSNGLDTLPY